AGTPQYMSPEQAQGEAVDHRSDLFSLGSVLYAMCTGRPPFRATGSMAVLKRVCEDTPRPIREINPEIPDWLCEIVAKLHAKNPAERFQSAKEVAELLSQHLAHLQQPNLVPAPSPSLQKSAQRRPITQSVAPASQINREHALRVMIGLVVLGSVGYSFLGPVWGSLIVVSLAAAGIVFLLGWRGRRRRAVVEVLVVLAVGGVILEYRFPRWWKDLWTQGGQIEDIPNDTTLTIDCKDPEIAVVVEGEGNLYSGGLADG